MGGDRVGLGAEHEPSKDEKYRVRLLPFLPDGMVTERLSRQGFADAAKNAPFTAPGRSEHPPVMKEREISGKTDQNLLDADRHSHGRP
jgi:hypothetical protein